MIPILLILAAYLLGAIPTSFWIGRWIYGVDLRNEGSGNLGATNAFRILGWRAALPVVIMDVAKGWLPVWLFPHLHGDAGAQWIMAYAAAVIVGHVFSFWVGFRGGKGVATSGGVFLQLSPWSVLVGFLVWAVFTAATRYVSVGSIGAALALPIAVYLVPHEGGTGTVYLTAVMAVFVIWAHRSNVSRLLRGQENRFVWRSRPETPSSEPAEVES